MVCHILWRRFFFLIRVVKLECWCEIMTTKESKTKAVLSGFCADSMALGVHWNYDAQALKAAFPDGMSEFLAPGELSYKGAHVGKGNSKCSKGHEIICLSHLSSSLF